MSISLPLKREFVSIDSDEYPNKLPDGMYYSDKDENNVYFVYDDGNYKYYRFKNYTYFERCLKYNKMLLRELRTFHILLLPLCVYKDEKYKKNIFSNKELVPLNESVICYKLRQNVSLLSNSNLTDPRGTFVQLLYQLNELHRLNIVHGNLSDFTIYIDQDDESVLLPESCFMGIENEDDDICDKDSIFYPIQMKDRGKLTKFVDVFAVGLVYVSMMYKNLFELYVEDNINEPFDNKEIPETIRKCFTNQDFTIQNIIDGFNQEPV